jgi:tetratricopeptide (TPR) repeat protein
MLKRCLTYSGIILLNLTGLGLGFLALRRWNRWRAHFMITAAVFLLAVVMNAYQSPTPWIAVAAAWVLVTVVEGCLQISAAPRLPAGWLLFLLGAAAWALTAGGIVWFEESALDNYTAGLQAYRRGDCQGAMDHFDAFNGFYRFSLSPLENAAAARSTNCRLYLFAVQAGDNGYESQALQTLGLLAVDSPEALPHEVLQNRTVYIQQGAAMRLATQGAYQQGIQMLLTPSRVELTAGQVATLRELAAQMTIAWGDQVYTSGDDEQALHILGQVANLYADTHQVALARQHMLSVYQALAETDFQKGDLEGSLSIYLFLQQQYPDMAEARAPSGRMVALYTGLAASSEARLDYSNAVKYYEALLSVGEVTMPAQMIHLKLADITLKWASELYKQGQFEQSLGIYEKLVSNYGDTQAAAEAAAQIPFVRLAWVDDLYTNNQFELALEKLAQMQLDYPNLPMSAHVAEKYPELYLAWGQSLLTQEKYGDAIQRFEMVKNFSLDAKVLARAQNGIDQAQTALVQ